jgi:ERCC4-type nuclease
MLIAPSEPPALRAIGKTSALPERFGADVLFTVQGHRVAVQRKEAQDLRASVTDGRLGKELGQMEAAGVTRRLLVVEGNIRFSSDGTLIDSGFGRTWSRAQWLGVLLGVMERGCWVLGTSSLPETIATVQAYEKWCRKDSHGSLSNRPKPGSMWGGRLDDREWGVHLLQGIDGVGAGLAGKIFDQFGSVPVMWAEGVDEEWLTRIEGIGKKKAAKIHRALSPRTREM